MSEPEILKCFKSRKIFMVETNGQRRHILNVAKKRRVKISTRKQTKGGFKVFYV